MLGKFLFRTLAVVAVSSLAMTTTQAVTIETVPVGNLGNADDTRYETSGYGAVDYTYNIGKYEVTSGQYCEFLNAVDPNGTNALGLYNSSMDSSSFGCQITWNATLSTYDFSGGTIELPGSTASDWENRPVNYVSFWDACRFANWLHNGQGSGSTENGVYTLTPTGIANNTVARNAGWKWAVASEDEWYKAAYHKNDGDTGNYYDYPTTSDSTPGRDMSETTNPGNNANYRDGDYLIGSPYYRTEVGQFALSNSPYGTFDQGGNVLEWNEAMVSASSRGLRGGRWSLGTSLMQASSRVNIAPGSESVSIGFRVASSSEPVPGDTDNDGHVDETDAAALASNWCKPGGWAQGDFNHDGIVNAADASIMAANWGTGTENETRNTPEPGSMVLLICGLVGLMYRRRRS